MAYTPLSQLPSLFKNNLQSGTSQQMGKPATSTPMTTPKINVGGLLNSAYNATKNAASSALSTVKSNPNSLYNQVNNPSMGVKATNPAANVTQQQATLPSSMAAPKVATNTNTSTNSSSAPITNIDNVNHTYMQGSQKYAVNPQTGRYEAVATGPTQPVTPNLAGQQSANGQTASVGGVSTPNLTSNNGIVQSPNGTGQPVIPNVANTPAVNQLSAQNGVAPTQDNSYQGLIGQLIKNAQMSPEEVGIRNALSQNQLQQATAVGNEQMMPETNAYQTGRTGIINQIANAQQANIAAQAENYAKQREVATSALNTALGYTKPITMQYGQALVNPTNAQDISNGQGYSGVQGLTNLGIANTNIAQGQGYQRQAADLATTMNQIDQLTPALTSFMTANGLNSQDSPWINKSLNTYKSQNNNPANIASLNAMMGDLKTYTAQILGSSGLTPTEVGETMASFDVGNLTPAQISAYVSNLRNMGQMRLQPLQQASQSSYGANVGGQMTPYMGSIANPTSTMVAGPETTGTVLSKASPMTQTVLGTLMNFPNEVIGLAGKIFK